MSAPCWALSRDWDAASNTTAEVPARGHWEEETSESYQVSSFPMVVSTVKNTAQDPGLTPHLRTALESPRRASGGGVKEKELKVKVSGGDSGCKGMEVRLGSQENSKPGPSRWHHGSWGQPAGKAQGSALYFQGQEDVKQGRDLI